MNLRMCFSCEKFPQKYVSGLCERCHQICDNSDTLHKLKVNGEIEGLIERYGQPTPRMKLVAILSAVEGHISNSIDLHDGRIKREQANKIQSMLQDAQEIIRYMPEGAWE